MVATSGKGWRLAPSLVELMGEVDARWPGRDTSSDGSIGDLSHAARSSEHNPDRDSDPMPVGYVSAVDITKDSGAQAAAIIRAAIADTRTWYVIHDGHIWSRTHDFARREYDGENPHAHHVHISLVQTARAAADASWWGIQVRKPAPKPSPRPADKPAAPAVSGVSSASFAPGERTVKPGNTGGDVAFLQRWLGLPDDGVFGPKTEAAVKRYQRLRGLRQDGVVGPLTWRQILGKDHA